MDNLEHKLKQSMLYKQTSKPEIVYLGNDISFNRETKDFYIILSCKPRKDYNS